MKIVYFTHSLRSCWNHGNAHFVRGVLRQLVRLGHAVTACEPSESWSLQNLLADHGEAGLAPFHAAYSELRTQSVASPWDAMRACDGADLVIVHEWTDPVLVAAIGQARRTGRFTLLFHDTHHRAVSEPETFARFDLREYDGVLAFGETLADTYRRLGWGRLVFVWHEAADTTLFQPAEIEPARAGLVWIGNWGDGERTTELEQFLLAPARDTGLPLDIFGVRYPAAALTLLRQYGACYHGWVANAAAPDVFARHFATVHVPRRFYATQLPGIPTIRVFEALACGIPLASAPWEDRENLFRPGADFLVARDRAEMARHLRALRHDGGLRDSLIAHGLETIGARHTCAHRAHELLAIVAGLRTAEDVRETEHA